VGSGGFQDPSAFGGFGKAHHEAHHFRRGFHPAQTPIIREVRRQRKRKKH